MMSGHDVLMMPSAHRVEVFTGTARRRRWSAEQKAQIVEDSYATSVSEAAARHGVSRSQLFNWRREGRKAASAVQFARVELEAESSTEAPAFGVIEVALGGGLVRLGPGADRKMVTTIIMALQGCVR